MRGTFMQMNILEGLKRLYIVFSLLVVTVTAVVVWDSRQLCAPAMTRLKPLTEEFDPGQQAIDPNAVTWDKPTAGNFGDKNESIGLPPGFGQTAPIAPCQASMKRVGATALGAMAAGIVLLIAWLIFRWVISGFLPSQTRTK